VIFSHSSARAVNDHPRNIADTELLRLRTNGGVVQLTFVPAFVSADVAEWTLAAFAERQRLDLPVPWTWPRAPRQGESDAAVRVTTTQPPVDDRFSRWLAAHPRPAVSLVQVADHVDHARDVAGVAHVGLGGDYDGVDWLPAVLADVSGYPLLLGELADRGVERHGTGGTHRPQHPAGAPRRGGRRGDPLWPALR
jgi:membrane dipeptidase